MEEYIPSRNTFLVYFSYRSWMCRLCSARFAEQRRHIHDWRRHNSYLQYSLPKTMQTNNIYSQRRYRPTLFIFADGTDWQYFLSRMTQIGSIHFPRLHRLAIFMKDDTDSQLKLFIAQDDENIHFKKRQTLAIFTSKDDTDWKYTHSNTTQTDNIHFQRLHWLAIYTFKHDTNGKYSLPKITLTGNIHF